MLKNLKGPPFTVFGIVRFFKINNFSLKNRVFSDPARYIRFLFFFQRPVFFLCDFFSNLFSSKPPPQFLQFLLGHKEMLKGFGTMRLTGDLHKKFRKKFPNFVLMKGFRLRKMVFLLFPVGKEWC